MTEPYMIRHRIYFFYKIVVYENAASQHQL